MLRAKATRMTRFLTFALLLAVASCGGKDKGSTTTKVGSEGGHHEGRDHENLTPELNAFHDLLAPRWHAAAGAQRIADTCSAIEPFKAAADSIGKSTPPVPTHADSWTTATRALVGTLDELAGVCAAKADATFDAAFTKVHEAFHELMRQANAAGGGGQSGAGAGAGRGDPHEHHHSH
jgi:hypothetical protein